VSGVPLRAAGAFVAIGLMLVLASSAAGQSLPLVFIGNGATPYVVSEGLGTKTVTIPVTLNQASSTQVTVDWHTQSAWFQRTASDSGFRVDYQAAGGTVVFAPGQTSKTVSVSIFDDGIAEEDETFVVALSNPVGAQIGVPADFWTHGAVVTIHDNELGVLIGEGGNVFRAPEGDSGTTPFDVSVRLNFASASPVTAAWTTREGLVNDPREAATADQDYQAASGTVTFAPGETEKSVAIQIIGDTLSESAEEEFLVSLTNVTGAQIGVPWDDTGLGAIVGIQDDDPADIAIDDVSVNEGDAGTTTATFTLTRSSFGNDRFPNPVTVDWVAESITAQAGSDFLASSGTVTFGGLTATIDVPIVGDTVAEPNETFRVTLSNPQNAVITDGVGIGTIVNDDGSPPPPSGPCIVLSKAAVAISGTASTPSTPRHAESEHLTVHNCGDSAARLNARGTDASGTAGSWELRRDASTSVCDLGVNVFRAELTLWLSGGQAATPLAKTDTPLVGPDGTTPFSLGAAADQEFSTGVDLPCAGSVGLGDPMTTNVTLTAVAP
jgi:Calx-beta domain